MNTHQWQVGQTGNFSSITKNLPTRLLNRWLSLSEERRKEEFIDTAGASRVTGVSQRTIQRWIVQRKIGAVPIGGRHQVDLRSLRRYLKLRAYSWAVRERRGV